MTPGTEDMEGAQLPQWLNEVRSGSEQAFNDLCAHFWQRWVIAIGYSIAPNLNRKCDPEDVLLEAVAQAWRDIATLEDTTLRGFYKWVLGIARKRADDQKRYYKRKRRDIRREASLPSSFLRGVSGDDPTPSKSVVARELRAKTTSALDALCDQDRAVIVHRILEGHTSIEVAHMTGSNASAVRVRLHRALGKLGNRLRERGVTSTLFMPP